MEHTNALDGGVLGVELPAGGHDAAPRASAGELGESVGAEGRPAGVRTANGAMWSLSRNVVKS